MSRYFVLLLAGLTAVSICCSCSKPSTKGTGTISLQDMGNGVCFQSSAGLMWQTEPSTMFSTYEEAEEYVAGLKLGGFNDWRLPTRNELLSLSELLLLKKGDCSIRIKKGHWVTDNNRQAGFWDDYPLCGGPEFRWVKSSKGLVRAVRP